MDDDSVSDPFAKAVDDYVEPVVPLVPPLEFNPTTRDTMPSISPRDALSYKSDKRTYKEFEKYSEKHPEIHRLLVIIQTEILRNKPADILDYMCDVIFGMENEANLKKELGIK